MIKRLRLRRTLAGARGMSVGGVCKVLTMLLDEPRAGPDAEPVDEEDDKEDHDDEGA